MKIPAKQSRFHVTTNATVAPFEPKPVEQNAKVLMFNLVDKRADKVDETALQLWEVCCLRSVHHGLVGGAGSQT